MKQNEHVLAVEERLERLERRLRRFRAAALVLPVILVIVIYAAIRIRPASARESGQVLTVRGLVIEDAQGRPRILLGAPVPKVAGRRRQDDAIGLIVLGDDGADRVAVGAPTPAPQIRGQVAKRIASSAGLVFDDADGNERGGMGVLGNGRGVACLDYPPSLSREAICMAVLPEQGFAGLAVNAESGSPSERAEMAVLRDGTSLLKVADTSGNERAILLVQDESPAQLLVIDPKAKSKVDALAKIKP
jgi:hypothetical protein